MVELYQIEITGESRKPVSLLWLPPANKAASWKSMGYDPYDYYDLGEFDQKGGVPTWFGSKADLLDLIESAHALGLQVYADLCSITTAALTRRNQIHRRTVALDKIHAEERQVSA
jgi:Glycosidases